MRNLKVSENGLLNSFKINEFNKDFQISTESIIRVPGTRVFSEEEIVNQTLLML
jgi:hypothetical protein